MASKISSYGFVTASGNQLYFEREGNPEGRSILFIHGLGGTTNSFQLLVPHLQEFDLVRFDWSGHGRSGLRPKTSVDSYLEDCEAVIAHRSLQNVAVVAHSLGGLIALHLAAKRPDVVKSLVLFGPVNPPPEAGQRGLAARSEAVRKDGMAAVADTVVSNAFAQPSFSNKPASVALAREMLCRQNPEGYALACEALAHSTSAQWEKITAKVIVASGEEDKVSTVAVGESICDNLTNCDEQYVWKDTGHWHMLEQPDESVSVIKRALS